MVLKHFSVIFFVVALSGLTARPLAANEATFGVKAGFCSAGISGSSSGQWLGLSLGGFASIRLTERLRLQPELDLVRKGDDQVSIRCLEIPLLFKYSIMSGESTATSLLAGPYLACKIHSSGESPDSYEFRRPDFGAVIGAAQDFKTGKYILVFDIRYDLGITEIDDGVWTRTLIATVGIGF